MPNLDFVRSFAVLTVVVEHTLLSLGIQRVGPYPVSYFGVLGVFVFFVLTSLVLMWSLERRPHTLDFYIRRFFRIYPLAWAVILIAVVFHAPTAGTAIHYFVYLKPAYRDLVAQSSLVLLNTSFVMSVMWSLPLEVLMYALLPMFFFFIRKNFSIWPLMLLWSLIVINQRYLFPEDLNFITVAAYFLPGLMAYVAFGRWKPRLPGWALPIFLTAMWALFLYRCNFHKLWIFCLIVGLGLPLFRQMKSEWILAPSRQIAKYSYGVYLTHPFAIVIGMYLLRGHSLTVRLLAELGPLLVFPVLAYHLLEHPMIRLGSRIAAKAETMYEQREIRQFRNEPVA